MEDGHPDLNIISSPLLHPNTPEFTEINPPHPELDGPASINPSPYYQKVDLLVSVELNLLTLSLTIMQPKSSFSCCAAVRSGYV